MPVSAIEDQQGVGRGADLAADLAQMVSSRWYSDWHDDRRRFTLARADRPNTEAE